MKENEVVWVISPKPVWRGRTCNVSDIDKHIMMLIVPEQYKELFRGLINECGSLDVIMAKDLQGFDEQCLKEYIRLIFYDIFMLTQPDLKGYSTHGATGVTRKPEEAARYNRPASEWEFKDFPFKPEELEDKLWIRKKVFQSDKDTLSAEFLNRNETYWGIETNSEGESTFISSGYSGTQCTGFAHAISKRMPGRTKIYGFQEEDNPLSEIGRLTGGHDFVVIDNRYIIDPWLIEVESGRITTKSGTIINLNSQGVFDLEDVADKYLILMLYGSKKNWKRMDGIEAREISGQGLKNY